MYKHERITLVILAYVIGFSTAFIAFNFVNQGYLAQHDNYSSNYQYISDQKQIKTIDEEPSVDLVVEKKSDGLYALFGNNSRILSAQAISATSAVDGYHFEVFNPSVSPSGLYINYCAQLLATDSDCKHYLYNVETDTTYKVTMPNGEQLVSDIVEIFAEWLPGDILTTTDYISANGSAPWELFAKP